MCSYIETYDVGCGIMNISFEQVMIVIIVLIVAAIVFSLVAFEKVAVDATITEKEFIPEHTYQQPIYMNNGKTTMITGYTTVYVDDEYKFKLQYNGKTYTRSVPLYSYEECVVGDVVSITIIQRK